MLSPYTRHQARIIARGQIEIVDDIAGQVNRLTLWLRRWF
ncbi:hypothetical protein MPOCJGCO_1673 [Methylobacterium trifolii]|uniref:Uncharacterized protein n=1 Tax=Methylobacterium trifolii TaxID=1003092 RepID=A0ABQ4TY79_9HYPH|nr:hypothetical protein MPOCJGCO_1673 [Methylobacterium trifolii]